MNALSPTPTPIPTPPLTGLCTCPLRLMDEFTSPSASPRTDDEAPLLDDVGLSVVGLTLGGLAHFSK